MAPMIEESDNDAATTLWNDVGGPSAVGQDDADLGMTATTPSYAWGLTTTTAADQVDLLKAFAFPNPVLSTQSRSYGLSLMGNVETGQNWGVTGGVPPGVTVALKNGWLPLTTNDWQVNSIGFVSGDGRDYVLAVLTDDDPTEAYGISTIDGLSSLVFSQLASG
jgi:beta-lactamase class A